MKLLYPQISPYNSGQLQVSTIHRLYFEEVGNPEGIPAIFLHGGPGGGCIPDYRRFFDPEKYRVVLFDQRGCGRSTPFAELRENTTWDLVADIEKIREHLGIQKWLVFGGSWGSTLSLAYGQSHPDRCLGFVLRGIFLLRQKELKWFYQEGASRIYPDAWEHYIKPIPEAERDDLISAFHKRLTSNDPTERLDAARAWSVWEGSTSKLIPDDQMAQSFGRDEFAEAFARIECHYFVNHGFFDSENQLLDNIDKIQHLPCSIIQGRYDVVCPAESSWELHKAWPEAEYVIVPDAGHSAFEAGINDQLVQATDKLANQIQV